MQENIRFNPDYLERLSFAAFHSDQNVIRRLNIENHGTEDILNAVLRIRALPEFMAPFEMVVPRVPAGKSVDLGGVDSALSPEFVLSLTAAQKGQLKLTLSWEGGEAETDFSVEVMPFDWWTGASESPELMAAFSTPFHPAVTNRIVRSAEFLEKLSVNGSFQGYREKDPNRVLQQVSALYSAVQELNIDLIADPPGVGREGYRVRLADEVTEKRQAGSLDLSLFFASLMEAVGLNPLLLVYEDRILPGVWLLPEVFPETVNYDPTALTRRAASGMERIALFDSTGVTGTGRADFNQARDRAAEILNMTESFICSVDVRKSRSLGIAPLPIRVLEQGRYVLAEPDRSGEETPVLPREVRQIQEETVSRSPGIAKQKIWERKLLDLSLRNSLLNYRVERGGIALAVPDLGQFSRDLSGEEEFTILSRPEEWNRVVEEDSLQPGTQAVQKLALDEYGSGRIRALLDEAALEERGQKLVKGARSALEETGSSSLYLALGMLRWYSREDPDTERLAPLILVPVEAESRGHLAGLGLKAREEEAHFNITLQEMLKNEYGILLSDMDPLPGSGGNIDLIRVFSRVRSAILREKKWDVLEQAHLGLFSFARFIMWNDLTRNLEEFRKNSIVDSLIQGQLTVSGRSPEVEEQFLEDVPETQGAIYPVSSDATQSLAVLASIRGSSFVLHGPPGTGKSQTITNIIANALMQDKRVLFVAQKMAALEVVEKRLNNIGIGTFCLELHSNKGRKKAVLDQLEQSMKIQRITPTKDRENIREESGRERKELNEIVKRLYAVDGSGYSIYDLITGNSELKDFPKYIELPRDFCPEDLKAKEAALDRLARMGAHAGGPYGHPLRGVGQASFRPDLREEMEQAGAIDFTALANRMNELLGKQSILQPGGLEEAEKIVEDLSSVAELLKRSATFADLNEVSRTEDRIAEAETALKAQANRRKKILEVFRPEILKEDARALERSFFDFETQNMLGRMFRKNPAEKQLMGYLRTGNLEKSLLPGWLKELSAYEEERSALNGQLESLSLGLEKAGSEEEAIAEIQKVYQLIADSMERAGGPARYSELAAITARTDFEEKLSSMRELLSAEGEKINKFLTLTDFREEELESLSGNYFDRLGERTREILPNLDLLRDWLIYQEAFQSAVGLGLQEMAVYYHDGHCSDAELLPAFRKSVLRHELKRRLEGEELLLRSTGHSLDEKAAALKALLDKQEILERKELYDHLSARIPNMVLEKETSREIALLQRALRSGARNLSIRSLFAETDQLLRRIAPCMLMSPMSVAQYLKPEAGLFDLVVFDEASQIPTSEAIGALGRARQAIIVGDPKQLPPTSFFMTQNNGDGNVENEDLDNILEDCLALSLPESYLLWHYRSRHESLIAFSNRNFYDGSLYTYPSPDDLVSKVSLVQTGGVYERGGARVNRTEAAAVADEVARRLRDDKLRQQSLGIVTFSQVQQDLIERLMGEKIQASPDLEKAWRELPEPLFVKNLENVQGDERDVIIFSVGYGPDENGRMNMNFGPVNQEGGWRRLNVAVTRARLEMMVFTNIDPLTFHVSAAQPRGVRELKAFLDFAARGSRSITLDEVRRQEETDLAALIAQKLRERGWRVETRIGTSRFKVDLGILHPEDPGRFILGILCGGESFREARAAYDREVLQPSVLKGLGWEIMRIYAMDWMDGEEKTTDAIEARLKDILAGEKIAPEPSGKAAASLETDKSSGETPYILHQVTGRPLGMDEFLKVSNAGILSEELLAVIQAEEPISRSLLTRRAVALYELPRATERLETQVEQILNKVRPPMSKPLQQIIYWGPEQKPSQYEVWRRTLPGDTDRLLTDIAPEEVMACMVSMSAAPISERNLVRNTSAALGYPRLNIDNEKFLKACLDLARLNGKIRLSDEGLLEAIPSMD